MRDTNRTTSIEQWTTVQAYALAVICLLVGIAAGWFIRALRAQRQPPLKPQARRRPGMGNANGAAPVPTPAQMQQMADTQAAPLLEKLKAGPNNAKLLENIGDCLLRRSSVPTSIDYYQRSLKVEPANAGARTDMATAYWYSGNPTPPSRNSKSRLPTNRTRPAHYSIWVSSSGRAKWISPRPSPPGRNCSTRIRTTKVKTKSRNSIAQAQKHSGVKPGTTAKAASVAC